MARENILEAIGDISRDKGIDRDKLVTVIQEAVTQAAKRKFKQFEDIEARINEESGELEVFRYKTVAENPDDLDNQIPLEEARKLDSLAEPGDEVEYEIDNKELSRVIAQTARQLIFQKIREAERETIYENFKDRVGEVLHGIVSRTERGRTFVTFNQTEAILYRREQIPHERYSNGDHIRVILLDVLNDPKEPSQLVVSRADPDLLIKLFDLEVPEVYDGIVEIVDAAREPGRRAKIAVRSNDPDVDPVGACVGLRGSRVQSIISELRGEKIDIIHFTDDLPTYVANALAPAELSRVKINEEEGEIDVEVDSDQLSLAIGRFGQNVRLASKLVGYKINVMSPQESELSLEEQIRQTLLASQVQMGIAPPEATPEASGGPEAESAEATTEATAEAGGTGAPATADDETAGAAESTETTDDAVATDTTGTDTVATADGIGVEASQETVAAETTDDTVDTSATKDSAPEDTAPDETPSMAPGTDETPGEAQVAATVDGADAAAATEDTEDTEDTENTENTEENLAAQ
ncbi:MAG: transcription termination factor NusA, partial [SAR324 cluster bacterium]|nr:transcription termination factor NusA [SAR324 cluster bacterium]